MKEYRIYGRWGQWGEVHYDLVSVVRDLHYCDQEYAEKIAAGEEEFAIEERDVTEWRPFSGIKEDAGTEEAEGGREEEDAKAPSPEQVAVTQ